MAIDTSVGTSIHAGFPNAADDQRLQDLSLDKLLVARPNSTFYFRIAGTQWQADGIFDGDIALVDRSLDPRPADCVIWWKDDEFAVSRYRALPEQASVWGVITATIHPLRAAF